MRAAAGIRITVASFFFNRSSDAHRADRLALIWAAQPKNIVPWSIVTHYSVFCQQIVRKRPMKISDSTKHIAMGAVGGAVALAMVGYSWDFFLTPGEADIMATQRANQAVGVALAPFCAEKFRRDPNATAKLAELKKMDQWQRGNFVEQGGWAKTAGESMPNSAISAACAELLVADKVVKP